MENVGHKAFKGQLAPLALLDQQDQQDQQDQLAPLDLRVPLELRRL